jgi:predicted peroxiredoxin
MKLSISGNKDKSRAARFVSEPKASDFSDGQRMFSYDHTGITKAVAEIKRMGYEIADGLPSKLMKDKSADIKEGDKIVGKLRLVRDGDENHLVIVMG